MYVGGEVACLGVTAVVWSNCYLGNESPTVGVEEEEEGGENCEQGYYHQMRGRVLARVRQDTQPCTLTVLHFSPENIGLNLDVPE